MLLGDSVGPSKTWECYVLPVDGEIQEKNGRLEEQMSIVGGESFFAYLGHLQLACIPDAISAIVCVSVKEFGPHGA